MSFFLINIIISFIVEIPVLNSNSLAPDQTPRFVASDQGLHICRFPFLRHTKHKLVTA